MSLVQMMTWRLLKGRQKTAVMLNNQRHGKEQKDERHHLVTLIMGEPHAEHHVRQKVLKRIGAERALKLRDVQPPEAAPPVSFRWLR